MQADGQGLKVDAELVSGNYFEVLGIGAAAGRTLIAADDVTPGANPVAVLSHEFWRTHYAANPGVVGQTIRLNGHPFEDHRRGAAGFPRDRDGLPSGDLRAGDDEGPDHSDLRWAERPANFFLQLFGRLKPGMSPRSRAGRPEVRTTTRCSKRICARCQGRLRHVS